MAMGRYRGINGVSRKVTNRYKGVDGIARKITKGYRGIAGVARQYFSSGKELVRNIVNGRDATVIFGETGTTLTAEVRGGSNERYAYLTWDPMQNGEQIVLHAGDTVKVSFTGTRRGAYCDYGIIIYTAGAPITNTPANKITNVYNTELKNYTYTATQDCHIQFICSIGGINDTSLYATISITDFQINGERVWVEL